MSNSGNSQRDPEILALFIEESEEALQRMERVLLAAERAEPEKDQFNILFRDIHTIKGTSGFLNFAKTATVSHAAEDLLSLLRDHPLSAVSEHFTLQVAVVDVLRQLIDWVSQTGDEGPVDTAELTERLKLASQNFKPLDTREDRKDGEVIVATPSAGNPVAGTRTSGTPSDVERADAPPTEMTAEAESSRADVSRQEPPTSIRSESADATVRVNVGVLDRLMNLMGELVLTRNQVLQLLKTATEGNANAQASVQRLSLVTSEMQEEIMKTRMQPVARVFERIPRMVRDLCQSTGKRVSCQIDGTTTEIDKALVEAVRDPIMHIVRNAVDHGMENPEERSSSGKASRGILSVRASHEGGMVIIEIADDGRGMDPKRLREKAVEKGIISDVEAKRMSDRDALDLVFRPGFSTAAKVSDISGRGVGMDVVRTSVERAGGQVELDSVVGRGTKIRLKMPLTLAIIPALLVNVENQRFAIPQINLTELVYLDEDQSRTAIENVRGTPIYRLRGEVLPLVRLRDTLKLPLERANAGSVYIVVVSVGACRYGLVVDQIYDTEEIVIKPLHGRLKRISCYAGATVLGDGGLALILDVAGIAGRAGLNLAGKKSAEEIHFNGGEKTQTMLVFTAGGGGQCAVPLAMVARLEQVARTSIENAAGREVLQYRGGIMPIVRPESVVPIGTTNVVGEQQQLVVFDFGNPVGMAVERILDIVDVKLGQNTAASNAPSTLGQSVIFEKTTVLLDVYDIVRRLVPNFTRERPLNTRRKPRVILADDSTAMRAAIGEFLRSRGLDVVDVPDGESVMKQLRSGADVTFDAIITDHEMPGMSGLDVVTALRADANRTPIIVWSQHDNPDYRNQLLAAGANVYVNKLQREDLVAALIQCGVGNDGGLWNKTEAA